MPAPLEHLAQVKAEVAAVTAHLATQAARGRQLRRRLLLAVLVLAASVLAPTTLCVLLPTQPTQAPATCTCPPPVQPGEALSDVEEGSRPPPLGRPVPEQPADWQKKPPCEKALGEEAVRGACYVKTAKKPPCELLLEHASGCYRAIVATKPLPVSVEPEE